MVKTPHASTARGMAWVQSLVKELRSCMMCSTEKKKGKEAKKCMTGKEGVPLKIACLVGQHGKEAFSKHFTWPHMYPPGIFTLYLCRHSKCENKRKTVHPPQHTGPGHQAATQAGRGHLAPSSLTPSLSPSSISSRSSVRQFPSLQAASDLTQRVPSYPLTF